jgi:HTH-type transcriptional regulator/antitoxin HipB
MTPKEELARVLADAMRATRLSQEALADKVGMDRAKISRLLCGKLKGISLEKMMAMLTALGRDVEVRIVARGRADPGAIRVTHDKGAAGRPTP